MGKNYLGEFEEVVLLTVGILGSEAYGLNIKEEIEIKTARKASIGALHSALNRLENKGYLTSFSGGSTKERGGRRKRFFELTPYGKKALLQSRQLRDDLWNRMPDLT